MKLQHCRSAVFLCIAIATAMACGGNRDTNSDEQTTDTISQEIYNATSDPDTTYPSVGFFKNVNGSFFCSGTLVAPNVVLTASHCFAAYAHGCTPLHAANNTGAADINQFVLSAGGLGTDNVTFAIDDIKAAPSAYTFADNDCPAGSAFSCSTVTPTDGLRSGSDLMLVHLATSAPASFPPMHVLTGLADNYYASGAIGHATLDAQSSFYNRGSAPQPHIVGWGSPTNCTGVRRRSGLAIFEYIGGTVGSGAWHKGCSPYSKCNGSARPDLSCSTTDANGNVSTSQNAYKVDSIRVARTSSVPGAYDGPVVGPGDSGGPLLLDWSTPTGAPITYVVGTASRGQQSTQCGALGAGYLASEYSAAFTAETGIFIEKTLTYWNSVEYQNRNLGWHSTWQDLGNTAGGALASGPSADAQGANSLDSFALGPDSKVYQFHWNGSFWSTNGPISNDIVTSPPASTSWGPGRVDIAARASNGNLLHWWYTGAWHVENLGGLILAGTGPSIATWGVDSVHIFLLGTDAALYYKHYDPGIGWSGFDYLGAYMASMTSSPTVVAWAPGRLDVFAQRSDDKVVWIYNEKWAAPDLGWQTGAYNYFNYPIQHAAGVAAASWAPGRIDIIARNTGSSAMTAWARSDQGWYPPAQNVISATSVSSPSVASMSPGRLDLFTEDVGSTHHLLHSWFPNE